MGLAQKWWAFVPMYFLRISFETFWSRSVSKVAGTESICGNDGFSSKSRKDYHHYLVYVSWPYFLPRFTFSVLFTSLAYSLPISNSIIRGFLRKYFKLVSRVSANSFPVPWSQWACQGTNSSAKVPQSVAFGCDSPCFEWPRFSNYLFPFI